MRPHLPATLLAVLALAAPGAASLAQTAPVSQAAGPVTSGPLNAGPMNAGPTNAGAMNAGAMNAATAGAGSGQAAGGPLMTAPSDYKLGAGDKVRVTVYGEQGLTGEYFISTSGALSVPLIGEVHAAGLTPPQLAAAIRDKLADGYIRDPKVAAEVLTYRP